MTLTAQTSQAQHCAIVHEIKDIGDDVRIIRLRPQNAFSYKAGQYINISFNNLPSRPYSIAVAPDGSMLEIHIKRGKGPASLYALDKLKPGEEIEFSGPGGHSWYDENRPEPIVAIAGGLGIAPIKAIAEQAMQAEKPLPFTLYWGTFTAEERYLEDYFKEMAAKHGAFDYHPVIGDHVGTSALQDIEDFGAFHVFVSGPPGMISDIIPRLLDKGAQRDKISYDRHPEAAKMKP